MKRFLAVLVVMVLSLAMVTSALAAEKIGVSMPTQSLQRWNQDGANMKEKLEAAGFEVDLQYAGDNEVALQVSQLENMILGGAKVLVVASIDGSTLGTVLADAAEQGIKVIAYDRLITATDAVDYYATFDNEKVGTIQGEYIETKLGLKDGKGPFNIEFVGGSPDDTNAGYFFKGAMDVLAPYLENGQLVCPSGQTTFEEAATMSWKTETAQARFDNIITANYATGAKLDAVMCSNDSTAMGVLNALANVGTEEYPIITGQDCDKSNMPYIIEGKQSMSVFKDTRTLAAKVVEMVQDIMAGKEPEVNDTTTYDNGVKVVPSYLCAPVFGDASNYVELLIDSGYYTLADIGQ